MDDFTLRECVEELLSPPLDEKGVELVELVLTGSDTRKLLRLFIDRPEGITIDECASLSRELADVLDTYNPIQGSYVLEVSSPGLDRPLKSPRDYERAQGRLVKLIVDGRGEVTGKLLSFEEPEIALEVNGDLEKVDRSEVQKANLHFEF